MNDLSLIDLDYSRPARNKYEYSATPVIPPIANLISGLIGAGEMNPSIIPATTSSGIQPTIRRTASIPRDFNASPRVISPGITRAVPINNPAPPAMKMQDNSITP